MPRLYCDLPLTPGDEVSLPAGAARHVQVLRLQPGDSLTLFDGLVHTDFHIDIAAAHAHDRGLELAALAVEQSDHHTGLQAQHLHMAGGTGWQAQRLAGGQRHGAMETGHRLYIRP